MPMAVGVIETMGFPAVLAAADAMVKGGRVTLVFFDKAESGRFYIAIRGPISEVKQGMEAGKIAGESCYGGEVMSHYIIPNPTQNIVDVLDIDYSALVEPFQ